MTADDPNKANRASDPDDGKHRGNGLSKVHGRTRSQGIASSVQWRTLIEHLNAIEPEKDKRNGDQKQREAANALPHLSQSSKGRGILGVETPAAFRAALLRQIVQVVLAGQATHEVIV